jgi:uncharacterized protein (TIGR00255 family)
VSSEPARSQSIRSMTGFAQVRRSTAAGELVCNLRSVNHRGLDLHFSISSELAPFENAMRVLIKGQITRGHIEVRAALTRQNLNEAAAYDSKALGRYLAAFRQASSEFGLNAQPDLNVFLVLPGVITAAAAPEVLDSGFETELLSALSECLRELNAFREREGRALASDLDSILAELDNSVTAIRVIRENAVPHFQTRLGERLAELLGSTTMTEARIAEEAALLADKSDIQEEVTRLTVHTQELRRMLSSGGEIGKRLDFLLQEINRETNTVLAKSAGAGEPGLQITNLALGIKANIERMREQALNFE